ncbi:MAG TPA: hypothetical protein VFS26_05065 [Solirubrobacterales bacterium]|nr:hypothetical protein [Solirubrobacterales bacterium]
MLVLVGSALIYAALFAAAANACSYAKGEQVFDAWGDPRYYVLVPDGDFAAGAGEWTLDGGGAVVSQSLSLPAGSSAVSPSLCIAQETPFFRAMARDNGVAGSKLQVKILYEDLGTVRNRVVSSDHQTDWDPTQPLAQSYGLATQGGSDSSVRIQITAVGGDWKVDDFYIDPFARY